MVCQSSFTAFILQMTRSILDYAVAKTTDIPMITYFKPTAVFSCLFLAASESVRGIKSFRFAGAQQHNRKDPII